MTYPSQGYQQPPPGYPQTQPHLQQPQPQLGYSQPQQQGGMPPAPTGAAQQLQQGVMQQIFNETANQPIRQPINRDKPHDSENIVKIKHSELKSSQKDARMFLLIEYVVIKSTVEAMIGREYGYTLFLSSRPQLQELSDLAKWLWGQEAVRSWAAQNVPFLDIAASVGQNLIGKYAKLQVKRNTKSGSIAYEEAFPNHIFSDIGDQEPQWQPPPAGYQPQSPQGGVAPPTTAPQQSQMPMPGAPPVPQQPQGGAQLPPPQGAPQPAPQQPQGGAQLPPPQGAPQPAPPFPAGGHPTASDQSPF